MERQHNRVTPEEKKVGEWISRRCDTEVGKLISEGEWDKDERCASCAFRYGTIPNGCPQTMLDVVKSIMEKQTFSCHVARDGCEAGVHPCMGWFATMQSVKNHPIKKVEWQFSKPE